MVPITRKPKLEQVDPPRSPPIAWLTDLEIGLGIWQGVFEDVPSYWLRWCDRAGNWLLTVQASLKCGALRAMSLVRRLKCVER